MLTQTRTGKSLVRLAIFGSLLAALLVVSPVQASATPPAVSTGGISNVTYSSAILYGFVNPRGAVTNYYFQYGTTGQLGTQTPLAPAGNANGTSKVDQAIAGLEPGITYHYRIVAVSTTGRANGAVRAFKTPKIPLSLQIVGVPNPVSFGAPFTAEGALTGTGASTREVVLQANPFPYTAGFKTVGNPQLTSATGSFSFGALGLNENSQIRVMTVGNPVIVSPVVTEEVAVRVLFRVRRTHRHGVVRFYGTVAPAEVGAQVGFQLLKPGHKSVNEGGTVVRAGTSTVGKFSANLHLRHRGVYRALVKIDDGAHVSAYSEPIIVR
jgi:hypothetical protein